MRKHWIVVLGFLLPGMLLSQIVNIEDKRMDRDTSGWFGRVDIGLNVVQNATTVLTISAASRVDYLRDNSSWLLIGNYHRVRAGDREFVNDGFGHLRHGATLSDRLTWETFIQGQYNERIRLNFRGLIGTGPRWTLLQQQQQRGYLGVLYMFEYDEIAGDRVFYRDHRISSYLSFFLKLAPNVALANTSYYQPIIKDLSDARLSSLTSLQFKISDKLSLLAKCSITYDARIAEDTPDIPPTTINYSNVLRLDF